MKGSVKEDEWCDVSDVDIPKVESDEIDITRDVAFTSEKKRYGVESSMPTLFSNDLPPCGLEPQLAYENVVQRLRKLWLERATHPSANLPTPSLCRLILDDLKTEEENSSSSIRTPWRRDSVFQYELRWAKYFVREAETAEKRHVMTEKQLDKQEFMDRMFPIPKEVKIPVRNQKNQKMLLKLWKTWHHGKRGTVETEDVGFGVGGVRDDDADVEDVEKPLQRAD